ncbi:MAG TPA: ATP-dependent zinc metalloprotease FtsH [Planctomycetaceae bacterium]|nr:ATP-dependent zinc metalloprotease FtsH [Planctomycetaceae bacterium]
MSFAPWLLVLGLVAIAVIYLFRGPGNTGTRVTYSFFQGQVEKGNVKSVKLYGENLTGVWKKIPPSPTPEKLTEEFNAILPERLSSEPAFLQSLESKGVEVEATPREPSYAQQTMFWLIGSVLLIFFLIYMMRRNVDPLGGGMMGSFIRSQAKRFQPSDLRTTFEDVAALEQAKIELQEIVEFLKSPGKFERLGAQIPKGVLLMGPPGTGKTLLARAVAGEAGVPFFSINGSEFIQMFVGVGASRVRDLFRTAKENAPCILFVDEIDAVGRERGAGFGGGHDEREQTLNQILSEMDGFQQTEAVIVLAATNRPDVLDPALLRPGRFDRHVTIDRPTREGRAAILKVHCRKVPLSNNVDLDTIASATIGFSGADLRNLVNEAALIAARVSKNAVEMEDFEHARDKILLGPLREDILNDQEKEITAYHESGHALMAWLLPDVDLIHKVTIIPRGRSLGVTQLMPDEERYNAGEKRLHSQLAFILGGRAAERLMFEEYSAGAEDDLRQASQLARRMVAHWGMSEVIGPVAFRQGEEHPFLGKEIHEQRKFSEETAHVIDREVQRFLTSAQERAIQLISDHRDDLDRLARALLERESLGQAELKQILGERAGKNGEKTADVNLPYPSSVTP